MLARKHFWIGISSGLFPGAGHGSTRRYTLEITRITRRLNHFPATLRMPKCVSGKLSLNHRVFTRGRYRASDSKLYASCSELHQKTLLITCACYQRVTVIICTLYKHLNIYIIHAFLLQLEIKNIKYVFSFT